MVVISARPSLFQDCKFPPTGTLVKKEDKAIPSWAAVLSVLRSHDVPGKNVSSAGHCGVAKRGLMQEERQVGLRLHTVRDW